MGLEIGALHVRRSTFIRATPARVWEEFESFGRISEWFGRGHVLHTYDPSIGGKVELSVELDGKRQRYGGEILVFTPQSEVSFTINWHDPALAWPVPTLWTLRLTPLYDGTLVEIFHHGFERLGRDAGDNLEGYEEGWDNKHLKALRSIVEA
jgi:uncharacterized protein YndB with AHSA1/START domain